MSGDINKANSQARPSSRADENKLKAELDAAHRRSASHAGKTNEAAWPKHISGPETKSDAPQNTSPSTHGGGPFSNKR
jgi:hypothetical protein